MHAFAVARCRPPQLVDRTFYPMPDCAAVHVAFVQELVGALRSRFAMSLSLREA